MLPWEVLSHKQRKKDCPVTGDQLGDAEYDSAGS